MAARHDRRGGDSVSVIEADAPHMIVSIDFGTT